MMTTEYKVEQFIKTNKLISPGEHVLIGVSGGLDSTALFSILYKLRYKLGITISVAHLNHHLRKESGRDQKFVALLCQTLNIPCLIEEWKRKEGSLTSNIEEKSRQKRIAFLIKSARNIKAQKIALAHHQDDLAETVLMRLLRGSGLQGLRGMLPFKKLHGHPFIRPLLCVTRKELEEYVKNNNLTFVVDKTNFETQFLRNKIRQELMPLLEREYNPNIKKIFGNLAETTAVHFDYLEQSATSFMKKFAKVTTSPNKIYLPLNTLKKKHPALIRSVLRQSIALLKGNTNKITWHHIADIEDLVMNHPGSATTHLPHNLRVKKESKQLILYSAGTKAGSSVKVKT